MRDHINQANHNNSFHDLICENQPDKYFDWKITCLFYSAIHLLKALANHRGKAIGDTHFDINKNIRNDGKMPLARTAYRNYMALYNYSQSARYDGFGDFNIFNELKKKDYQHALKCFNDFKSYVLSAGVVLVEKTPVK